MNFRHSFVGARLHLFDLYWAYWYTHVFLTNARSRGMNKQGFELSGTKSWLFELRSTKLSSARLASIEPKLFSEWLAWLDLRNAGQAFFGTSDTLSLVPAVAFPFSGLDWLLAPRWVQQTLLPAFVTISPSLILGSVAVWLAADTWIPVMLTCSGSYLWLAAMARCETNTCLT